MTDFGFIVLIVSVCCNQLTFFSFLSKAFCAMQDDVPVNQLNRNGVCSK